MNFPQTVFKERRWLGSIRVELLPVKCEGGKEGQGSLGHQQGSDNNDGPRHYAGQERK